MPHAPKTQKHYSAACANAEIWLTLTDRQILTIRPKLMYEKRQGHVRGRVLSRDLPALGLLKGDRLEPTAMYPDIANFTPEQAPRRTKFWRSANQTSARWRNPLFQEGTGMYVESCGIDWLHVCSMGVFRHLAGHFVQEVLMANCFDLPGTCANLFCHGVNRLNKLYREWLKTELAAGKQHTKIDAITDIHSGTSQTQSCIFLEPRQMGLCGTVQRF
jgi:hypothetical protein